MNKKLSSENLQNQGKSTNRFNTSNPFIFLLMGVILIFLIIGQFFLPITTIKYDGKKKGITLLDFAVSERMDLTDFTSDTMFFFTEEISMEDFLNKSNTSIDKFFDNNGISIDTLINNVKEYKSDKQHNLLIDSYQEILDNPQITDKTAIFNTDIPMSEFILANKLVKEVKIKAGTKTLLTASLTSNQFNILIDNYFESGFASEDGMITFIIIMSVICCIGSLISIIYAYIKNKSQSVNTSKAFLISFGSISFAKMLAFFADIIIKGDFSGDFGKYASWTRFVLDLSPKDEVHISTVPIHISLVLGISIIVSLGITIGILIKNKNKDK